MEFLPKAILQASLTTAATSVGSMAQVTRAVIDPVLSCLNLSTRNLLVSSKLFCPYGESEVYHQAQFRWPESIPVLKYNS